MIDPERLPWTRGNHCLNFNESSKNGIFFPAELVLRYDNCFNKTIEYRKLTQSEPSLFGRKFLNNPHSKQKFVIVMWDTCFASSDPKRNVNFRPQSFCENGYTQFERPAVFDERLVENGWEKKSRLLTSLKKK